MIDLLPILFLELSQTESTHFNIQIVVIHSIAGYVSKSGLL